MGRRSEVGFDRNEADDASNEHYSMFFVEEEGTLSSLRGVRDVIEARGLFCALYTDRGSHYWHTEAAGGKVDRVRLTQFGRARKQLVSRGNPGLFSASAGPLRAGLCHPPGPAYPRSLPWRALPTWRLGRLFEP